MSCSICQETAGVCLECGEGTMENVVGALAREASESLAQTLDNELRRAITIALGRDDWQLSDIATWLQSSGSPLGSTEYRLNNTLLLEVGPGDVRSTADGKMVFFHTLTRHQ